MPIVKPAAKAPASNTKGKPKAEAVIKASTKPAKGANKAPAAKKTEAKAADIKRVVKAALQSNVTVEKSEDAPSIKAPERKLELKVNLPTVGGKGEMSVSELRGILAQNAQPKSLVPPPVQSTAVVPTNGTISLAQALGRATSR